MKLSGQTVMNLTMAVNEMDIGYHYRQFFTRKIPGLNITSPYKCDGFAVHEKLRIRLLFEFKKEGANLDTRIGLATVLIQAIYYIKKFELDGIILPSTIFLGDRNNFTILHTNDMSSYLAMPLDWSTAPSSAAVSNPDVVKMIKDDERINPFIFSSNQLDDSVDKIKNLTQNVTRLIPITSQNITRVFDSGGNLVSGFANKYLVVGHLKPNCLAGKIKIRDTFINTDMNKDDELQ